MVCDHGAACMVVAVVVMVVVLGGETKLVACTAFVSST
jgi:hypothetical protein